MATRLWTPSDLGTALVAWWDASRGVTLSGSTVTKWVDVVSGLAANTTANPSPTFSSTARNGKAGLLFSGGQELSFVPAGNFSSGSLGFTMMFSGLANTNQGFAISYGTNASQQMPGLGTLSGNIGATAYDNDIGSSKVWSNTDQFPIWQVQSGPNPLSTIYADGVQVASKTMATFNTPLTNGFIGRLPAGLSWSGVVQQILIVNRVLTVAERQFLEGWESWYDGKNGSNLAANHPYKSAAPTTDPSIVTRNLIPADFGSNLALWLNNDTPYISTDSGLVSKWTDRSGNGRHATASGALRPSSPGTLLLGKPTVKFAANTANRMDIQNIVSSTQLDVSNVAMFMVFRVGTGASNYDRFLFGGYNGARCEIKVSGPNNTLGYNFNNGDKSIVDLGSAGVGSWVIAAVWGNGTTVTPNFNGTDYATTTTAPSFVNGAALGTYAGGTSAYWDDSIAECILVQNCTRAMFDQTIGYLAWDKGLQGNLPANHPYKSAAPTTTYSQVLPSTRLATPLDATAYPLYYLDNSNTASITVDANNNVIARSSVVGPYVAKSSPSTWTNKPKLQPASANTFPLPSVSYSGGQADAVTGLPITGKTLTAFAVVDPSSVAGTGRFMSFGIGDGNAYDWDKVSSFAVQQQSGTRNIQISRSNSNGPSVPYTDGVPCIVEVVFDGTNATLWVNGNGGVTIPVSANLAITRAAFGASGDNNDPFTGCQGAQLLYDSALSAADRALIRGSLAWKWDGGVAGPLVNALPSNDPYKTVAPTVATYKRLWDPSDLGSDVAFFIDASDTSTITYRTGNYVNTISSKAGSVIMYSPDAQHMPPTIVVNGKTALQSSNNYGYLVSGGSDIRGLANTNAPATLVMIGKADTGSAYGNYVQFIGNTDNRSIGTVSVNTIGSSKGGADIGSTAPYTANGNIGIITFNPTGSNNTLQIYGDGVLSGSGSRAQTANGTMSSVTMLPNGSGGGTGFIFATLYINRVLSNTDRQLVEGWAAWNYNLYTQLPANHPYRNGPPTINTRPWMPTDANGINLFGWYRVRDPLGIVAQGADVFDGTNVTAWKDRSGKGNDLNPLYVPEMSYVGAAFGTGMAAVRTSGFYGGTGWAGPVTTAQGKIGAFSAVIQANTQNTNGARLISTGDNPADSTGNQDYSTPNAIVFYNDGGTGTVIASLNGGYGSATVIPNTPVTVGTYYKNAVDGVAGFTMNGIETQTFGQPNDNIPKRIGIGTNGAYKGAYWVGHHAEHILFMGTLTRSEQRKLEGYIAWNNGLQSFLPANHQYRTAAPTVQDTTPAAPTAINVTANVSVTAISSTSIAKAYASASVNATIAPVISLTPKVATAPLQNGNFILAQDGSLLDKVWAVADANSTPNANGSTYSFTQSTPPSITPVVQPTPNLSFDGVSLLLGPLNPTANSAQLINLTLRDQANAVVTTVPITLSQLSTDDMVWVTFKFSTPIMSTVGTSWSLNLSTESSTPMIVNGNGTSFAMMLRAQGLTVPPMNATQSFFVLPDCSGSVTTGRNLVLNPDADTSISKLVVSQGCTATFPSTNTYTLRVYDGIYDYTGSSSTDTGVDLNSDSFQLINNDFDYGRSYGVLDNATSAGVIKAFASAVVNAPVQAITGSGTIRAITSATSNGTITPVTQTTVVRAFASATSNVTIAPVLSTIIGKAYASSTANVTITNINSVTDVDAFVKATGTTTLDNVTQIATVQNYVTASPSYTIDPVISISASQEFVTANFTVPVGDVLGVVLGTVMVQGSSNNVLDNVISNTIAAVPGSVVANNTIDNITQNALVAVRDSAVVNYTIDPITQTMVFRGYASANVSVTVPQVSSIATGTVQETGTVNTSIDNVGSSISVGIIDQAQAINPIGDVTSVAFARDIVSANASYTLWPITSNITVRAIVQSYSNAVIDAVTLSETTSSIITSNSTSVVDKVWSSASTSAVVSVKSSATVGNFGFTSTGRVYITSNNASNVDGISSVGLGSVTIKSNNASEIRNVISLCYSGTSYHAAVDVLMDNFTSNASLSAITGVAFNQVFDFPTMTATGKVLNNVQLNNPIGNFTMTTVASAIASVAVNQTIDSIVPSAVAKAVPSLSGSIQLENISGLATVLNYVSGRAHTDLTNIISITSSGTVAQGTLAQTLAPILNDMSGRVGIVWNGNSQIDSVSSAVSGTVPAHVTATSFVGDITSVNKSSQDSRGTVAVTIDDVLSVSATSIIVLGKATNTIEPFATNITSSVLTSIKSGATIAQIRSESEATILVSGITDADIDAFVSNASGTVRIVGIVPAQIDPVASNAPVSITIKAQLNESFDLPTIQAEGTAITKFVANCYIGDITCEITDLTPVQGGINSSIGEIKSAAVTRARFYFSTAYQMLI